MLLFSCIGLLLLNGGVSCVSLRRNIGASEPLNEQPNETIDRVRDGRTLAAPAESTRKFQICEQFDEDANETFGLQLHGNGITVVMRLSA